MCAEKQRKTSILKTLESVFSRFYHSIYATHFKLVKQLIDFTAKIKKRPIGLIAGTLLLELGPCLRSAGRRLRYIRHPSRYGFDRLQAEHKGKSPVILLHGSMGKWSDVAGLARALKQAHIPVFVMNFLRSDCASEEERQRIYDKIAHIQALYTETFGMPSPPIDLIGHSLGGMLALYSSFRPECCSIDDSDPKALRRDRLVMREGKTPERHPHIGKVITIGMPSNTIEVKWAIAAGNAPQLYNVLAKHDAIIGDQEWALKLTNPANTFELSKGHLGVLHKASYTQIIKWLTS